MATINIDDELAAQAEAIADEYGYDNVEKYIEDVVYRDIDTKGFDASRFISEG